MQHRMLIEYTPFPQARPRICRWGTYDPSKKKKQELGYLIAEQWSFGILDVPIDLHVHFYMPIPKSLSKKKQKALIGQMHVKKPDIDNLSKAVIDTMTGLILKDDNIIWKLTAEKTYSQTPAIEIEVFY